LLAEHCGLDVHATQSLEPLHIGVSPEQSPLVKHSTQTPFGVHSVFGGAQSDPT
jgi:hypothetical protein